MGAGLSALEDLAEFGDPAAIARRRTKQLLYESQMVLKIVAGHEFVGGEEPHSGAAAQISGVRSGKKLLALAMRAGRFDRQHRGDFVGVEIVAGEAQGHECFGVGIGLSLRRGGFQAASPLIGNRPIAPTPPSPAGGGG